MYIPHNSIDDFIAELRDSGHEVFDKTVRCRIDQVYINEAAIAVTVTCSALMIVDAESEYITEFAVQTGVDSNGKTDAADLASEIRDRLCAVCIDMKLRLLPGKIEA